ncbi:MAG: hypothetical protein HC846_09265 [Blastocatellia bacterium]|nr:hypothetical protein [Blastocatellia bacterium]
MKGAFSNWRSCVDPKNPATVWVAQVNEIAKRSVGYGDGVYSFGMTADAVWRNVGFENE